MISPTQQGVNHAQERLQAATEAAARERDLQNQLIAMQKAQTDIAAKDRALAAEQEKARLTQLDLIMAQMKGQSAQGATVSQPATPIAPPVPAEVMAFLPPVPEIIAPGAPPPAPVVEAPPLPKNNTGLILAAMAGIGLLALSTKKGR